MHYNDKKAWEQFKQSNSLSKFGRFVLKTKAAKWYRNGTYFSPSLKWYHPLTWIFVVVFVALILPVCILTDVTLKGAFEELWASLTVDKFFKMHPEELRWVDEE